MEDEVKVPKTILEEILEKTILDLKSEPEFDSRVLIELEDYLKNGAINPEDLMQIIKGENR